MQLEVTLERGWHFLIFVTAVLVELVVDFAGNFALLLRRKLVDVGRSKAEAPCESVDHRGGLTAA